MTTTTRRTRTKEDANYEDGEDGVYDAKRRKVQGMVVQSSY
jgi:hypothetical protein